MTSFDMINSMKVLNQTRNTILTEDLKIAKSFIDQSLGLYKYKKPTALMLTTHFGIHSLFMKYPIDIVILDNQNKVVALKESMQPNEMFIWNIKYNTVLELPVETIKKSKTKQYDELFFIA